MPGRPEASHVEAALFDRFGRTWRTRLAAWKELETG